MQPKHLQRQPAANTTETVSMDYNSDLGKVYAEMLTVCQPFYALLPPTSNGDSCQQPSTSFYLHPRLEDGLEAVKRERAVNRFENPQDSDAGVVYEGNKPRGHDGGYDPSSLHQGRRQACPSNNSSAASSNASFQSQKSY